MAPSGLKEASIILLRREVLRSGIALAAAAGLPSRLARAQAQTLEPISTPYPAPSGERALKIANLNDLEQEVSKVIPRGAFAYIASGSDNQWTLQENRRAFDRYAMWPQYLVGKNAPDLRTTLLGQELSLPIITAPMGAHGLAHVSAEEGTAKAAGYSAIVFTIDAFAPGGSDETTRLGFNFPPDLPLVNSKTPFFKKSLSWDDVNFIQQTTDLPLVIKGVLSADLARRVLERGAAAIQVSNHGGRQLDGVPAALTALPAVVEAVRGRVPVIMDSGIRRGSDVFKALALGADAVALGRPLLYGLALDGSMGVKSVYDRIRDELTRTMTIAGAANIREVQKDLLVPT